MTDQAGRDLSIAKLLGGNRRGGLVRTLIVDIALPWLAVTLLERWGVPMVEAFAAAALIPLASVAFSWFEARRIEAVGAIVAATLLLGAGLALVSSDVRFSVVKAAPAYFAFGVVCLLSLLTRRPLMFFVARHFSTGGDPEKRAQFDARLAIPGFVRAMRLLTLVWGLTAVIEASCGIAIAITLPPRLALVAEPVLALSTLIALLFWTVGYSRRQTRRGAQ